MVSSSGCLHGEWEVGVVLHWCQVLSLCSPSPLSEAELLFPQVVSVGRYCLDLFCTLSNVTETVYSNYSFYSLGVLPLQGRAWVLQGKKIKKMHLMFSVKEWYKCTGRKEQVNRYVQWTSLLCEFLQTLKYQVFKVAFYQENIVSMSISGFLTFHENPDLPWAAELPQILLSRCGIRDLFVRKSTDMQRLLRESLRQSASVKNALFSSSGLERLWIMIFQD